ncbi:MAG: site-2 protease family protein [Candidatus Eisenbacteria bacterium]
MSKIAEGFLWYGLFILSATVHEAAHAGAALKGGDPTAHRAGQVTLDPWPHIRRSPFGMILLPIVSVILFGWPFGFASAPYDPNWAERYPKRAARMALAGPAANLALMIVIGLLIHLGIALGGFQSPESAVYTRIVAASETGIWRALGMILSMGFSLNLILLVLNLIPLPPLDGWSVLGLFFSDEKARRMSRFSARHGLGWVGILVAWQIFPYLLRPAFLGALNLLYPGARFG